MDELSVVPAVSGLTVPEDQWTAPFWAAARDGRLVVPRCATCGRFRWPPGPFCPACHAQPVDWVDPGPGHIYSYTIVRARPGAAEPGFVVPAVIEFAEAGGIRLPAALYQAPLDAIAIDRPVTPAWLPGSNVPLLMFRLC